MKNTWEGVKLLHFNKVTFSIKNFIFFKEFFNGFRKGYFWKQLSVVAFDKINFQFFIIATYLTKPVDYNMKATDISATMIHYREVLVKYPNKMALGSSDHRNPPGRNSVSCGKFTGPFERVKNRLLQVYDTSWKSRFWKYIRFDLNC